MGRIWDLFKLKLIRTFIFLNDHHYLFFFFFFVLFFRLASLNPSACSQLTKDILYAKAKRAFSDRHYLRDYYMLIEPYLGM